MTYDKVYIIQGNRVRHVVKANETQYAGLAKNYDLPKQHYNNEKDAHYNNMLNHLVKGASVLEFAPQDDHEYYINRLKKENPEYLI